ncbi:MAG TPA: nitrilase-related carbon-nitrogen hydrolase [candidate division Zixibacteria bacterium]|nr:nitrilase-related carbon-nitrogen hydrolase [candidate division Zixibacteria bacterium]
MRALLVQKDINNRDYAGFLGKIGPDQTDLVCFGELATSGCMYTKYEVPKLESLVENFTGRAYAVMIGFPHTTSNWLYNAFLYFQDGKYQIYRKINLFPPMNEDKVFTPGNEPGLFDTKFGKIGVAICYDLRFPEIFSNLKKLGAQMIFVPAAFPRVRIADWKKLLVERAIENNVKIIGINAVGDDGTNVFGGSTMVVDASGKILHQADETTEQVIEVTL